MLLKIPSVHKHLSREARKKMERMEKEMTAKQGDDDEKDEIISGNVKDPERHEYMYIMGEIIWSWWGGVLATAEKKDEN